MRVRAMKKSLALTASIFCLCAFAAQAAHTHARLLLAAETARPGDTVLAGVRLTMDPHWHTYWTNSGASGAPTEIFWQLPAGVTAGEILWPVPEKLPDAEFTTYIYKDDVILLTRLKLGQDLRPGPLEIKVKVSWLECEQLCVKGSDEVQASLAISGESKASADAPLLSAWEKRLPQRGDGLSAQAWWEGATTNATRPMVVEWNSVMAASEADFFPYHYEKFEAQGETDRLPADPGKIRLRKQVKKLGGEWPQQISGVLVQQSGEGRLGYEAGLQITGTVLTPGVTGQLGADIESLPSPSLWKML